jgi:acyl carrier protein
MSLDAAQRSAGYADVLDFVLELLEEITADRDVEPLSPGHLLGDLGLESINLVYLIAELQQEFRLGDALISALRERRIDIRRLSAGELATFTAGLGARTEAV